MKYSINKKRTGYGYNLKLDNINVGQSSSKKDLNALKEELKKNPKKATKLKNLMKSLNN